MGSVLAAPRSRLRRLGASPIVACLVSGALASFTSLTPARADWPMARHDAKRSGAVTGKSNIQTPTVAWSAYLGGSLAPEGLLTGAIGGKNAFILASSGTVTARLPDGTVLWKVVTHGVTTLVGLADLDGDGKLEVIAFTPLQTFVIDLATGSVAWAQPAGEMGVISSVHMADMNGDGLPDLVIGEALGALGAKDQSGFLYSFKGGFSSPLGQKLAYPGVNVGVESTLANLDGKAGDELIVSGTLVDTDPTLVAVDGTTGHVIATTPNLQLGSSYVAGCVPANLGAGPTQAVVCIAAAAQFPTGGAADTSRVFAVTLGTGALLNVAWSVSFAPTEALSIYYNDLAVDLAGDGALETVVSGFDAGGTAQVHILSAASGVELASLPGELLLGNTPSLPSGGRLLTTLGSGGVSLWSFDAAGVHARGTINDSGIVESVDWTRFAISSAPSSRPILMDLNDDGALDVLTIDTTNEVLSAYTPGPTQPAPIGTITLPVGTPATGAWPLPAMDRAYPQLGLIASDGRLRLLDKTLSFTSTSIPVGGYYLPGGHLQLGRSPVVGSLDGGPAQILVDDSRGALVRLDASAATATTAPVEVWAQSATQLPIIAAGLDGDAAGIFAVHVVYPSGSPAQVTLERLHADGSMVWETPLVEYLRGDLLLAHFTTDGVTDLAYQSIPDNLGSATTHALSGADGHVLWSSVLMGCGLAEDSALVDWNGDGIDDVVQQSGATFINSGVDGSPLASGGPTDCYALPIPFGTPPSLVYTSSFPGTRAYAHDLTTQLFASADQDEPFPYGAIAACPTGNVLLEGSATSPSKLALTTLDGSSAGATIDVFLAAGALYQDEASADAAGIGQLTAVNVHSDLTGNGSPTAVVGSTDGWLYAVDPCAGTLTFVYSFGAPVGEPVFGDTDGDGLDEIIVSVDDGYLYALKNTPQGTGGGGGSGGGGTGGTGGTGGGSMGTGGTGGARPAPILLWGRATCACELGAGSPLGGMPLPSLAFAVGLLAAVARRRRHPAATTVAGGLGGA